MRPVEAISDLRFEGVSWPGKGQGGNPGIPVRLSRLPILLTGKNLQTEKMDELSAGLTDPVPRRETALNLEYKRQKNGA